MSMIFKGNGIGARSSEDDGLIHRSPDTTPKHSLHMPHIGKHVGKQFQGKYWTEERWIATFAYGSANVPKLLTYDLTKLVKWGGILSMFQPGTVFTMDASIYKNAIAMLTIAALSGVAASRITNRPDDLDPESLELLAAHINAFVPFVLALYLSLTLSRWWALRVQALGAVFDSLANVCMLLSCECPEPKWQPLKSQVMRYGLASVELLVKAARKRENMESLVESGLLDRKEVTFLTEIPLFQRVVVIWAWILRACSEAFKQQSVPPPRFNAIQAQCMQARNGVQTIHTYLATQLPFAYVHIITFLVNVQNLVVAVKSGVVFVIANSHGDIGKMVNQVIMCVTVCIIYQGLLAISYVVQDPFGEDILDFPVMAYAEYVSNSCDAAYHAQENAFFLDPERNLYPPKAPQPPPAPAPPAAPVQEKLHSSSEELKAKLPQCLPPSLPTAGPLQDPCSEELKTLRCIAKGIAGISEGISSQLHVLSNMEERLGALETQMGRAVVVPAVSHEASDVREDASISALQSVWTPRSLDSKSAREDQPLHTSSILFSLSE